MSNNKFVFRKGCLSGLSLDLHAWKNEDIEFTCVPKLVGMTKEIPVQIRSGICKNAGYHSAVEFEGESFDCHKPTRWSTFLKIADYFSKFFFCTKCQKLFKQSRKKENDYINSAKCNNCIAKDTVENKNGFHNCSICLSELKADVLTTPCNHSFHSECFNKIEDSKCPLCRAPFVRVKIVSRQSEEDLEELEHI